MLFTSIAFACLLAATWILYYLPLPGRAQVLVLITSSFMFYAWSEPWLLTLLVLSCTVNAVSSFGIFRSE